jgi:MFS family permease
MPVSLVCLLALGHCAAFADRNLPAVAAPLLKVSLGLSDAQLGLLDGPAFAVLYVVGMLASWPLASSPHRFRLLAGCIATWAFGMMVFALGRSFDMLLVARALVGLGQAAFVPLALGLIVERSAPQWRARSMAVFTAASVAGRSVAFLMGGAVLALLAQWAPASASAHWRLLFLVMAAPNLVLIVMLLRRVERAPALPPPTAVLRQMRALFRRRPGLLFTYFCSAGASVLVVQTIGAWAPSVLHREQGLVPATAALAFGSPACRHVDRQAWEESDADGHCCVRIAACRSLTLGGAAQHIGGGGLRPAGAHIPGRRHGGGGRAGGVAADVAHVAARCRVAPVSYLYHRVGRGAGSVHRRVGK